MGASRSISLRSHCARLPQSSTASAPPYPPKQTTAMTWLTRRLRRPATRQGKDDEDDEDAAQSGMAFGAREPASPSPPRPRTAPSSGLATYPRYSPCQEPPLVRPLNKAPARPPRPDSDVIRDVNAWLDASMIKPAPPLMAGIPYWREGAFSTGSGPSAEVRYAAPIRQMPEAGRAAISHGQQIKSFCRRAKKMQVRMPSLLRARSQRSTVAQRKQPNRRSTSMPLLSKDRGEGLSHSTPRKLMRSRSLIHLTEESSPTTWSSHSAGWIRAGRAQFVGQSPRLGSSTGARFDDQESSMERHVNAVFGQTARLGGNMRPSTALARIAREDSMGNLSENLSDAPTYSSGLPPPSYRSRAASVRTTSSFGCIDAMNSTRRQQQQQQQLFQQKLTQQDGGVKGKFRKLAQIAIRTTTKETSEGHEKLKRATRSET